MICIFVDKLSGDDMYIVVLNNYAIVVRALPPCLLT